MNSDKDITQIGIAVEQINIDESHINNQVEYDALSILPTRNLVMFPGVTISIGLGREMSEKVALHAYKNMKPVGIVCQRDPDNESPKLTTGMYRYGVVADILKVMDIPGGEKTLLVRAREPFKILGAGTKGGYPASTARGQGGGAPAHNLRRHREPPAIRDEGHTQEARHNRGESARPNGAYAEKHQ